MMSEDAQKKLKETKKEDWEKKRAHIKRKIERMNEELEKEIPDENPDFSFLYNTAYELAGDIDDLRSDVRRLDLFKKTTRAVLFLLVAGLLFFLSTTYREGVLMVGGGPLYLEGIGLVVFLAGFLDVVRNVLTWYLVWESPSTSS